MVVMFQHYPVLLSILAGTLLVSLWLFLPTSTMTTDSTSASTLASRRPRVLCWVGTYPANHASKAAHVKATWGKRCDRLLIFSTERDEELGAVALPNITAARKDLWNKTRKAFAYVWKHHREEADWFVKADDDTYIVVDNLRSFLKDYNTETPIHFGHRFVYFGGYMAGGAGYVLSKAALRLFAGDMDGGGLCGGPGQEEEDVRIGQCLQRLNVTVGDSRDSGGRARFLIWNPKDHIIPRPGKKDWSYRVYSQYDEDNGTMCCSDSAISFHYVPPDMMYLLDYFLYHLRPRGAPPQSDSWLLNSPL